MAALMLQSWPAITQDHSGDKANTIMHSKFGGGMIAVLGALLASCAPTPMLAPMAERAASASQAAMPQAGPSAVLASTAVLTRIGVGSCIRQDLAQDFWPVLAAADPQLFLMLGDNVYGDRGWDGGADLATFRSAYATLAAEAGFAALRARVPMLATWDDHDYGPNDSGGSFAYKALSEQLFETFWDSPAEARAHDGIYHAMTYGPAGQRVQVIMLDTRYFRSDLATVPEAQRQGRAGRYTPLADPQATMLGAAQWAWLQAQLAQPADLRVVVSSIQVISQAHHFESWSNLPLERDRLFAALADRAPSGLVLLSGDRHAAGLYRTALPGGEQVWEMTASSLNAPMNNADPSAREPDPLRQTALFGMANYGLLEIDWAARHVVLGLQGIDGATLVRQSARF